MIPERRTSAIAGVVLALAVSVPGVSVAQPDPDRIEAGVAPGAPVPDSRPGEAFADPKVAQLQRTASDVQRELGDLAARIHEAEAELRAATDRLGRARSEREQADRVVAAQQAEVDRYSAAVFSASAAPGTMRVLLTADSPENFLAGAELVDRLRVDLDARLTAAVHRRDAAAAAEGAAASAERAAAERRTDLERRTADATNRAAAVSSDLRGVLAATDEAVTARQRAQRERNEATAANWRAYTARLTAAGIVAPPAAALRDPARLPPGLQPLPGPGGAASAQLPSGERLLVLPAETIRAVTMAVDALGRPYVPGAGGAGPAAYSCDGLVGAAYADLAVPGSVAEQLAVLTPVALAEAQPGDLVFAGPPRYGAQSVGILLDQHTMLTADARLTGVVVADLPAGDSLLGVARPALPHRAPVPAPAATDGGLAWRCGGVELPPRTPGEAVAAWGGYPNGFIPIAALCPADHAGHMLRCDAAQSFQAMSAGYAAVAGQPLCLTDSYRTFDAQVRLYAAKPALAAIPGTSNHGWGLAVDLCGGAETAGTPTHAWLTANARAFGWSNPPWARPGNGREEPWHWEFTG
ncbi:MAG TPA: D-alanyl-D-alanine carboxypeptidase family protein [Actinophytocola sp.]|uniref:D-alanyl-D-alanine carboxypeptidase family protein n=1 Tax=Actinophytocola sp. TaxID=1872138 RepID=UPI002DB6B910|nr:D-alanyl-D-alanine carboxypeptidase family protein [Actinophytocola sp.]HEU5473974.1 D-alanyl-D-alanine carboxypeptidase family protein [Actinophytocola sp.]